MNIKTMITIAAVALMSFSAKPNIINLGQTIGQPADLVSETSRLTGQINTWNLANNPDLPPVPANVVKTPANGGPYIDLNLTGFNGYLLFKWGNKDQFYFVTNETGTTRFNSTVFSPNGRSYLGLSHYDKWTLPPSVPDEFTSIFPLLGIVGLMAMANRQ